MRPAARSFTEPPGFSHSALPSILTPELSLHTLRSCNNGVLPIRFRIALADFGICEVTAIAFSLRHSCRLQAACATVSFPGSGPGQESSVCGQRALHVRYRIRCGLGS